MQYTSQHVHVVMGSMTMQTALGVRVKGLPCQHVMSTYVQQQDWKCMPVIYTACILQQ